jgi:hypothetical protein
VVRRQPLSASTDAFNVPRYSGAGITVCDRWLGEHGFENFLADMNERPQGTTLGRFEDVDDYDPADRPGRERIE